MSGSRSGAVPEPRHSRSETKSRCKSSRLGRWQPCASALRARGWRGRIWPGAPDPSRSRHRDALRGGRAGYLGPRGRAGSLRGGAAGCFPARKPGVQGSLGASDEPDLKPPSPRGPGWCWVPSGARGTCPKSTHPQSSTRSTFRVLGISLPIMFCRPAACLQRFGRTGETALFYFLPAMRCVHFFVLFEVLQLM